MREHSVLLKNKNTHSHMFWFGFCFVQFHKILLCEVKKFTKSGYVRWARFRVDTIYLMSYTWFIWMCECANVQAWIQLRRLNVQELLCLVQFERNHDRIMLFAAAAAAMFNSIHSPTRCSRVGSLCMMRVYCVQHKTWIEKFIAKVKSERMK